MLVSTPVRVDVLVLMTTELCARVFLYFSFPIDEILEMSHKSEHPPPFLWILSDFEERRDWRSGSVGKMLAVQL